MRRKNVKRLISLRNGPNRLQEGEGVSWLLEEGYIEEVYKADGFPDIYASIDDLPAIATHIISLYILTNKGVSYLNKNEELFRKRGLVV